MTNSTTWPQDRPEYVSLEAAVQGEAARWNIPGVASAILQDGKIEVATAGFANLVTKEPVRPDTLFQIGSITKIYTATLVQILCEEGVFDLDDPVVRYLPDFTLQDAAAAKRITIRHCISHQGGFEGDIFDDQGLGDDALEKSIATSKDWKQWVQPEELWFYNNAGFYIAGRVIEVVTGKTFEAVMTEKLLNPLGVPNTVLFTHDVIVRPHAVGHSLESREKGYTIAEPFAIPRHATAAGYVTAPVGELVKFAQMHLQEGEIDGTRILSAEAVKAMQEPQIVAGNFADHYGLGWAIEDFGGTKIIQHGGSTNGFQAHLDLVPGTGFAIATLTNGSTGTLVHDSLRKWALEKYRNAVRERPAPVKLKGADLKKRAGTWKRENVDVGITVDGDRLVATVTSYSPLTKKSSGEPRTYHLEPVSDDTYFVVDGEYDSDRWHFIDFDADRLGNERHLLRLHGRLVERIDAPKPAKKAAAKGKKKKG
jgi:CubicO group peptidase (beta-lactamase class C family)